MASINPFLVPKAQPKLNPFLVPKGTGPAPAPAGVSGPAGGSATLSQTPAGPTWADKLVTQGLPLLGKGLSNVMGAGYNALGDAYTVGSDAVTGAGNIASSIGEEFMHPGSPEGVVAKTGSAVDTAGKVLSGGLGHAYNATMPGIVVPERMRIEPGEDMDLASAVGRGLKDKYYDHLGQTLYEHPVQSAMDLATAMYGGGAAGIPKLTAIASKIDPLNNIGRVVGGIGKTAAKVPFGPLTGTTGKSLIEAAKAGADTSEPLLKGGSIGEAISQPIRALTGGEKGKAFRGTLSGKIPIKSAADEARSALDSRITKKQIEYQRDEVPTMTSTATSSLQPVARTYAKLVKSMTTSSGEWKIGDSAQKTMLEIRTLLENMNKHRQQHTPEDFDALRQRIMAIEPSAINPTITDSDRLQIGRAITDLKNSLLEHTTSLEPSYRNLVEDYAEKSAADRDISSALALGPENSTKTTARALQQIMRDNANTSFGTSEEAGRALEASGAKTLYPKLAAQDLKTVLPRGFAKYLSAILTFGGHINPASLVGLPVTMPIVAGSIAHAMGTGANAAKRAKPALRAGYYEQQLGKEKTP